MCDQIKISYLPVENLGFETVTYADEAGTYNGQYYYYFNVNTIGFMYIYFDAFTNQWVFNNTLGTTPFEAYLDVTTDCPEGEWKLLTPKLLSLKTEDAEIQLDCACGINLVWSMQFPLVDWNLDLLPTGTSSGRSYYEFTAVIGGVESDFILQWNTPNTWWEIVFASTGQRVAWLDFNASCPIGNKWRSESYKLNVMESTAIDCVSCGNEDRIYKEYQSVKLPVSFTEEARGIKECCCEQLVLGSAGNQTWTNDLTSAWMKLSSGNDSCEFVLENETGQEIILDPVSFVNEPNAYYATVNWGEILNTIGAGCYRYFVRYNISGVIGEVSWGDFKLKPYTVQNALKTARVRAIFNGYHEIEGINFSGSNVESTFRFYGFVGFRQPNYEIDNLIYGDRQMKRNLRENLNAYDVITDPSDECITKPLIDLYFLSENELFISDYNAHNHSYRYLDLPVIVQESPKMEYPDNLSRKAVVKCTVGDKFKNQRTYY